MLLLIPSFSQMGTVSACLTVSQAIPKEGLWGSASVSLGHLSLMRLAAPHNSYRSHYQQPIKSCRSEDAGARRNRSRL